MIDLYYWPTPNGRKISIMLEECGLPYEVVPVDIGRGDQFKPEFLKISPNNRMPAIVDRDTQVSVFESGAILVYLAEKTGKLLPGELQPRFDVLQWLFWQVGGLGPMAGQLSHFVNYAPEPVPYAKQRYADEYDRLLCVMDTRLEDREYLAGAYSIADIACFPWVANWQKLGADVSDFPHLRAWLERIGARPAVARGMALGSDWRRSEKPTDEEREVLFGQNARSLRARRGAR